ncbi:MAG: hypothetical protein KatS3mg129_0001 [Leptospiraceae bacterium]|nr:MAG: hypothetical protein KatS3mg129_0001 [Leptospiraceae bacterium]
MKFPLFFFFFLFCQSPYQYLIREYKINEQKEVYYSGFFLFIEDQNKCFQYEVILNSPLSYPFLPTGDDIYYNSINRNNHLIEDNFLWIRIYIKNHHNEGIIINTNQFYIKQNKRKINSYKIGELLSHYPLYLKEIPIFWYTIPKNPINYLKANSTWLKYFYFEPILMEPRKYKLEYYQNYFENFSSFNIEPDKEILFFLLFPHLEEGSYQLIYEDQNCLFEIPFSYNIILQKEEHDIDKEKEFPKTINKLQKQINKWQDQLKEHLKNHDFNELKPDFFF